MVLRSINCDTLDNRSGTQCFVHGRDPINKGGYATNLRLITCTQFSFIFCNSQAYFGQGMTSLFYCASFHYMFVYLIAINMFVHDS